MKNFEDHTTYVLDVDNRHCPSYVVGITEKNPASTMDTPPIMAIPGHSFYQGKNVNFHPSSFRLQNDVLVVRDELKFDTEITSLGRHFIIPFPGSFLDSNTLTRGDIQPGNPYAKLILKFVETLEFLLSDEGIHLTWAGVLKDELLPRYRWRIRLSARGEQLELKLSDKTALEHETEFYSPRDTVDGLEWFDPFTQGENPSLSVDPYSLQMNFKVDGGDIKVDKCSVYWEFVPLVEPDFGFSEETRNVFPEWLMFDKNGGIGCILKHFFIKDPRIDIQKGLLRLERKKKETLSKKAIDGTKTIVESALTQDEYNAIKYAISPRQMVEIFSILQTDPVLLKDPQYENPGEEIFDKKCQVFNPCHIFSTRPLGNLLPIWNTSFDYLKYTTNIDNSHNLSEDIFKTRPQCMIDRNLVHLCLESDIEAGADEFEQSVYIFPVPARVVRIPPSRVHPVVLSNCLIPCYATSSKHVRNIPFKEYGENEYPFLNKLMIPELTDVGLTELSIELEWLKDNYRKKKIPRGESMEFLVDSLRYENFGTLKEVNDIKFSIQNGKPTPCQTIEMIQRLFYQDFESESPKCPAAQKAIYDWIKKERKINDEGFSLFPDVYGGPLGFKYYENLTVSSNFDANLFEIIDDLYAMHQNHKYVLLIYSLLLLATVMTFGDMLYLVLHGPSQVSKSFIFTLVMIEWAIRGTVLVEGSQSNQAMNSGTSHSTGMLIVEDDIGTGNSKIFGTSGKENDSDANMKQMLTTKSLTRTVLYVDSKTGHRTTRTATTDHREVHCASTNNGGENISAAMKTRLFFVLVEKISRGLSPGAMDLKKAAAYPGQSLDAAKIAMTHLMQSRQAFTCLVFQGIRSGCIPYNSEQNLFFARNLHDRFKNSLMGLLDDANLPYSLRMENGQLFPLVEEKMISRIYKSICSGVFKGESSCLVPGAKFNLLGMFNEIINRNLLQICESDYIEAISYFDQVFSQETTGIILKTIGRLAREQTGTRESRHFGIGFGETPPNGTMGHLSNDKKEPIPRGPWNSYSAIFFMEKKGSQQYKTNYNWIDLGCLFPLPNLVAKDNDRSPILNILADAIQAESGKNSTSVSIFQQLMMFKDGVTEQKQLYESIREGGENRLMETLEFVKSPILKVVDQQPHGSKSIQCVQFVLLNSQWLHERLRKGNTSISVESPAHPGFKASATELALQCLSYKYCYPGEYLLPGMTFDKPLQKGGYGVPSIPKSVKLIDARYATPEYVKILTDRKLKPHLLFGQKPKTGIRMGYNGGKEWGLSPELDYFTTYTHIMTLEKTVKQCGVMRDGEYRRDAESIEEHLQLYIEEDFHTINSPVGMEISFNKIRDKAQREASGDAKLPNYIQTMMRKEESAVQNAQSNYLLPVSADHLIGFTRRKRAHKDIVMKEEKEEEEEEEESENIPSVANRATRPPVPAPTGIVSRSSKIVEEAFRKMEQEADEEENEWNPPSTIDFYEEEPPPEEEIPDNESTPSERKKQKFFVEEASSVEDPDEY